MMLPARTLDTILFFSDKGKVYSEKAYQIPDVDRTSRGYPIVNILSIAPGETITAAVPVPDFDAAEYCTMVTRNGRIKRVELSEFSSVRPSGLIAMGLAADDELGWVRPTGGESDVIIITKRGQALRFSENEVRPMGRPATGVQGIKLRKGDRVVGMEIVEPGGDLLIVTINGYGKRTPLNDYPVKGRATMGVLTVDKNAIPLIGEIAAARVVQAEEDFITFISSNGIVMRTEAKTIANFGRATRGVRIMDLDKGDSVAALARISAADLRRVGASEEDKNG
jgi:DNA gyrase subunit A